MSCVHIYVDEMPGQVWNLKGNLEVLAATVLAIAYCKHGSEWVSVLLSVPIQIRDLTALFQLPV